MATATAEHILTEVKNWPIHLQIELARELDRLTAKERWEGDPLAKTAEVLSTQPEHIINTLKRFLNELDGFKKKS